MSKVVFAVLIALMLFIVYNFAFVKTTSFAYKTKASNVMLQLQQDGDLPVNGVGGAW